MSIASCISSQNGALSFGRSRARPQHRDGPDEVHDDHLVAAALQLVDRHDSRADEGRADRKGGGGGEPCRNAGRSYRPNLRPDPSEPKGALTNLSPVCGQATATGSIRRYVTGTAAAGRGCPSRGASRGNIGSVRMRRAPARVTATPIATSVRSFSGRRRPLRIAPPRPAGPDGRGRPCLRAGRSCRRAAVGPTFDRPRAERSSRRRR